MNSNFDNIELPLVQVPVWSLKIIDPFKNLFPIRATVLSDITEDMTINGFDSGHPIVVWNMAVVDGHTRLKAAIAAGLEEVPVICHQFTDIENALEYAIRSQRSRRNLTDYELLQCLQRLDWKKTIGRPSKNNNGKRGRSSDHVAEMLGVSRATIERLRTINVHASEDTKEKLRAGLYSIHKAFEETMRPRRPSVTFEPDADAELIHSVMADIHSKMNTVQICKLIKALRTELAIN